MSCTFSPFPLARTWSEVVAASAQIDALVTAANATGWTARTANTVLRTAMALSSHRANRMTVYRVIRLGRLPRTPDERRPLKMHIGQRAALCAVGLRYFCRWSAKTSQFRATNSALAVYLRANPSLFAQVDPGVASMDALFVLLRELMLDGRKAVFAAARALAPPLPSVAEETAEALTEALAPELVEVAEPAEAAGAVEVTEAVEPAELTPEALAPLSADAIRHLDATGWTTEAAMRVLEPVLDIPTTVAGKTALAHALCTGHAPRGCDVADARRAVACTAALSLLCVWRRDPTPGSDGIAFGFRTTPLFCYIAENSHLCIRAKAGIWNLGGIPSALSRVVREYPVPETPPVAPLAIAAPLAPEAPPVAPEAPRSESSGGGGGEDDPEFRRPEARARAKRTRVLDEEEEEEEAVAEAPPPLSIAPPLSDRAIRHFNAKGWTDGAAMQVLTPALALPVTPAGKKALAHVLYTGRVAPGCDIADARRAVACTAALFLFCWWRERDPMSAGTGIVFFENYTVLSTYLTRNPHLFTRANASIWDKRGLFSALELVAREYPVPRPLAPLKETEAPSPPRSESSGGGGGAESSGGGGGAESSGGDDSDEIYTPEFRRPEARARAKRTRALDEEEEGAVATAPSPPAPKAARTAATPLVDLCADEGAEAPCVVETDDCVAAIVACFRDWAGVFARRHAHRDPDALCVAVASYMRRRMRYVAPRLRFVAPHPGAAHQCDRVRFAEDVHATVLAELRANTARGAPDQVATLCALFLMAYQAARAPQPRV
jgi:hypothetical protein